MEVGDRKTRPKWVFFARILAKSGRIRVADACGLRQIARDAQRTNAELVEPKSEIPYHFLGYQTTLKKNRKSGKYHENTGNVSALLLCALPEAGLR